MSEWFPQLFCSSECRFALRLFLQCALSHRHLTLGESPLGEQLGRSVLLVVRYLWGRGRGMDVGVLHSASRGGGLPGTLN